MITRRFCPRPVATTASGILASGGRQPSDALARRTWRTSFTLVELLTVVMIISILASTVLFALFKATQEAKIARTKAQIQRLNQLLLTRWESYRTRPIRISTVGLTPEQAAYKRLKAIRELIRLEMPDRTTDVVDPATYSSPTGLAFPALARHYWRVANASTWTTPNPTYDQAECLYMIVASIRENGTSGLDFLQTGEIGDVDGDGMPEILDAWGHPICFVRWAPGYVSRSDIISTDTPDPFDPRHVCKTNDTSSYPPGGTFALYPLIVSGGPDGVIDIAMSTGIDYGNTTPPNNPYVGPPTVSPYVGTPLDPPNGQSRYVDNITNQNEVK